MIDIDDGIEFVVGDTETVDLATQMESERFAMLAAAGLTLAEFRAAVSEVRG